MIDQGIAELRVLDYYPQEGVAVLKQTVGSLYDARPSEARLKELQARLEEDPAHALINLGLLLKGQPNREEVEQYPRVMDAKCGSGIPLASLGRHTLQFALGSNKDRFERVDHAALVREIDTADVVAQYQKLGELNSVMTKEASQCRYELACQITQRLAPLAEELILGGGALADYS